jgi:hypothetical protein
LITLLRKNPFAGGILLTLILLGSKWYMWQAFANDLAEGQYESLLALLTVLAQAIFLRFILKSSRLLLEHHFLVIFFFLHVAIQDYSALTFSATLVLPFLLLASIHLVIGLYNRDSSINSLMGIGSLWGIGLVIDPAFITVLPLILLALSYFILLHFRRALVTFYYLILVVIIGYGIRIGLNDFVFPAFNLGINQIHWVGLKFDPIVQSLYYASSALALIFILSGLRFLSVRSVKVRSVHRIFSISIPFIILYYVFSRELPMSDASLFAIPIAAIFAYYFENAKRVWIYECTFIIVMFIQAFTVYYYGT